MRGSPLTRQYAQACVVPLYGADDKGKIITGWPDVLSGDGAGPMTADVLNMMTVLENALQGMSIQELPRFRGELKRLDGMAELRMLTGQRPEHPAVELLTIPETAKRLKLSPYRTYELCRLGQLKAVRLGTEKRKSVRVRPEDLAAYIAHQGT